MKNIDPRKIHRVMMFLVFFCATPLITWVFLRRSGRLGSLLQTETCMAITAGLIVFTTAVYMGAAVFMVRSLTSTRERIVSNILITGIPGTATLRKMGVRKGAGIIKPGNLPAVLMTVSIDVTTDCYRYSLDDYQALVPEQIMPFLWKGMELPIRISPTDNKDIVVEWETLLRHCTNIPL